MKRHVCPVWIGYFLANPLRKLVHNPRRILAPYIKAGMNVMDIGPGLGFFSLPLAEAVGPDGRVLCVDIQPGMLDRLARRAQAAGLSRQLTTRLAGETSLGIDDYAGQLDFVLAFAVLHEIPDPAPLLKQVASALKVGGLLLIAEPRGHVTLSAFEETLALVRSAGFRPAGVPPINLCHSALLVRS